MLPKALSLKNSVLTALLLGPSGAQAAPLRPLAVTDERGAYRTLAGASGAPTLLLPIFASCTGTCPTTASALRDALERSQAPFRVVVFTFDPADTVADLKGFRAKLALPPEWDLVRAGDAAAARSFLDQLGFPVMTVKGGFIHPDKTFVLSPAGEWTGTFSGPDFTPKALAAEYKTALDPAPSRLPWLLAAAALSAITLAGWRRF